VAAVARLVDLLVAGLPAWGSGTIGAIFRACRVLGRHPALFRAEWLVTLLGT